MTRVAMAAAFLWLFCAAAFAQTEPEVQFFSMNNFHGDVELRYDFDRSYLRDRQASATTLTVDQEFDEIMNLSFDGFIYHPRLLVYKVAGGLDLTQGSTSIQSPAGTQNGSLSGIAPEYAISGSLLPQNFVSADFSFNRYTSTINPPFEPVTKDDVNNQLVTLWLKSGVLPTQVAVGHETINQTQMGIGDEPVLGGWLGPNHRQAQDRAFLLRPDLQVPQGARGR